MSNFIHFVLAYIGASLIFVIACGGRQAMTDLIKREDAIKAVRESRAWHFNEIVPVLSAINGIPSAENKGGVDRYAEEDAQV